MSFSCANHGWAHIYQPCPMCHPVHTYVSSGTSLALNTAEEIKYPKPVKIHDLFSLIERIFLCLDEISDGHMHGLNLHRLKQEIEVVRESSCLASLKE